jgi:adenine/guanine phosphoribosyltransferase-like PRPP-binding protein
VFFPFPLSRVRQGFDTPYEISARISDRLYLGLLPGLGGQGGINQAALLADNIRGVWKRQVCAAAVRTRETKSQSGLSLTERKRNVQGAFALLPGFDLRKKTCLIVDDVITSGNTFSALARLIEDYGGRPMGIFAARTEISSRSDVDAEKL